MKCLSLYHGPSLKMQICVYLTQKFDDRNFWISVLCIYLQLRGVGEENFADLQCYNIMQSFNF